MMDGTQKPNRSNAVGMVTLSCLIVFGAVYWFQNSWQEAVAEVAEEEAQRPQDGVQYTLRREALGARYGHVWDKWQEMERAGDRVAVQKYMDEEMRGLRMLPCNTRVYVTETTWDGVRVQVRPEGETEEHWIDSKALRIR